MSEISAMHSTFIYVVKYVAMRKLNIDGLKKERGFGSNWKKFDPWATPVLTCKNFEVQPYIATGSVSRTMS